MTNIIKKKIDLHSKLHSWYDKDDKYIDVVNDMYEDLDLKKEKMII